MKPTRKKNTRKPNRVMIKYDNKMHSHEALYAGAEY